jgi:hypothetical protein
MSDEPEWIWAETDFRATDQGRWWDINPGGDAEAYIRADIIEELEDKLAKAVDALEKLARLGNGDYYGNSEGNTIARAALADMKGEQHE